TTTGSTGPGPFFFFGNSGITVTGTKSTAETIAMTSINNGEVIFDTGGLKASAITVAGNTVGSPTSITADPPITSSSTAGPVITPGQNAPPSNGLSVAPAILSAGSQQPGTSQPTGTAPQQLISISPNASALPANVLSTNNSLASQSASSVSPNA